MSILIVLRLYRECRYIQIYALSNFQTQQILLTLVTVVYKNLLNLGLNHSNSWSFSIFLLPYPCHLPLLLTFIFYLSYEIMHTNLNLSILLRQLMFTKWKFLVIASSNRKTRIPLYIWIHKIPVCLKRNFLKHEQTRIQNTHSEYLLYFIHFLWWEGTSHSCSLTMNQWSELSPV